MKRDQLCYIDRRTGRMKTDRIYAGKFLNWCYNTRAGWLLTRKLLCRPFVSRIYGWYYKRTWTRRKIPDFVEKMGIDTSNCTQPLANFKSFNEFITRRISPESRPIDEREATCIAPADSRVWVETRISLSQQFAIKGATFELGSFLQDVSLADEYDLGTLIVCRLYLGDYHHFHFPVAGTPSASRVLSGKNFAVSPYSTRWTTPYFAENQRQLTLIESKQFGRVAMIEIGALTVGSIRQIYEVGMPVEKGARKGYFELGGSVVVLLFCNGRIVVDEDLVHNSQNKIETYVRVGEPIGRTP